MVAERAPLLASLGLGAALAWAVLPLLAALARRSRSAPPADYHRALSFSSSVAVLLVVVPALKLLVAPRVAAAAASSLASVEDVSFVLGAAAPELAARFIGWSWLPLQRGLQVAGALWLLAAGLGLSRLAWQSFRLGRQLRAAPPAPAHVQRHAAAIARRLGVAAPPIRICSGRAAPFAAGLVSPSVYLDEGAAALAPEGLAYTLEHELVHIARGDTRGALYGELARLCFAGHPSARWLVAELAWAREAAVDARVAGDSPRGYAHFLVESAGRIGSARAAAHGPVFMASTALARRIDLLTARRASSPPRRLALLGAAGLALGLLAAVAPASWASSAPPAAASGVDWGVAPEAIQASIRARGAALRACYDALPRPVQDATIELRFVVGPDGGVSSGHVDSPLYPALGACAEAVLRETRFPAPAGGSLSVAYPILFTSGEAATPASPAGAPRPSERLPREVIQRVVREAFPQFAVCYEALPEPRPALGLKMHFTIGTDGRVSDGHVDSENAELGACTQRVMMGLSFPPPEGGIVTVGYPLQFAP